MTAKDLDLRKDFKFSIAHGKTDWSNGTHTYIEEYSQRRALTKNKELIL